MNVLDGRNPVWGNEEHTRINLEVLIDQFNDMYGYMDYAADKNDVEEFGRQIFADAAAGKYGEIAALPVPTHAELVAIADRKQRDLLDSATAKITIWQTKLLMGRKLTTNESAQLNAWMDYIDAVTAIDTSTTPDIQWPEVPLV